MKTIALLSGGVDSTVAAYHRASSDELHGLFIDYGQQSIYERQRAAYFAAVLGATFEVVNLQMEWSANQLTGGKPTRVVVPMRNLILLSIGYAVAARVGADRVLFGVTLRDRDLFNDCDPRFLKAFWETTEWAWEGGDGVHPSLDTPFISMDKWEVWMLGLRLGVPLEKTWSCYLPGPIPCDKCRSCLERKSAETVALAKLSV